MNASRFDRLTRSLTAGASRRHVLTGVILSAAALHGPTPIEAKNKKQKLKRSAFGCVNVGGKCRGKDANCCSGICQGKKPKKGEKDRSRCLVHDEGGCKAGLTAAFCGGSADVPCTTTTGLAGFCLSTTGNGGYCANDNSCRPCRRDADCQAEFGPLAACTVCANCPDGTTCAVPEDSIED
jgi:hypothetical protein